jgi:hypothetical protein
MQDHLLEIMNPLSKTDPQVGQLLDRLPLLERWRQDDPEK